MDSGVNEPDESTKGMLGYSCYLNCLFKIVFNNAHSFLKGMNLTNNTSG